MPVLSRRSGKLPALAAVTVLMGVLGMSAQAHAFAGRGCGTIKTSAYGGESIRVVVSKGQTPCTSARQIATKFLSRHRGPFHGKDLASGYWIEYGWKCQAGTSGGSGCNRGAKNAIALQAFPSLNQQMTLCGEHPEERFCHESSAEQHGVTQAKLNTGAEAENHQIEEEYAEAHPGEPKGSSEQIERWADERAERRNG